MTGLGWPQAPSTPRILPGTGLGWPVRPHPLPAERTPPAEHPAPPGADDAEPVAPPREGDAEPVAPPGADDAEPVASPRAGDAEPLAPPREGDAEPEEPPIARAAAVRVRTPGQDRFPPPAARRVLAIANQKGGVGKTTTAVNVAVALALHGAKVLVVDLDPQGNASTGLGVEHHSGVPDVYDVLVNGAQIADVVQPAADVEGCRCVPATIDLAGAEIELVSMVAREWRLARALEAYCAGPGADLDCVLVDCPPSLGLLTVNGLVAARELFIPIQCEYYALEGVDQLLRSVDLVRAHLNPQLALSTILLTMYDSRTRLADQVAQEVRGHFGDVVLGTIIPRSVRVSEAPSYGKSVVTYDPGSRGALAYVEAAREIALRGTGPGGQEGEQ